MFECVVFCHDIIPLLAITIGPVLKTKKFGRKIVNIFLIMNFNICFGFL